MTSVQVLHELIQAVTPMTPDQKAVVNETAPDQGLFWVCIYIFFRKITHKYIGQARGYFCTHSCATYLQIILIIKLKMITCQDKFQQFT